MVRQYLWGIINAIVAGVSNAMAGAKNARIQRIKNMACAYRNRKRFRMAILFHLRRLESDAENPEILRDIAHTEPGSAKKRTGIEHQKGRNRSKLQVFRGARK